MEKTYLRLPLEQQQNPDIVLSCFNKAYTLQDAKQQLADCIEVALSTDNERYDTPEDRANLFRFSHFLEELMEACWIIDGQNATDNRSNKKPHQN